jgi:hypothetical protein
MNKNLTIICSILVLTILATAFQYVNVLKSEIVDAYSALKPANGHSWSEMECTSGLCVTSDNKVGIGTDSPSQKLEVNGTILGDTDVCNGSGACLSQITAFIGSQALVNNIHNYAACTAAGGTIVDTDASYKQCRFNAASCPTGWTQFQNWSTTTSTTSPPVSSTCPGTTCACPAGLATSGSHAWSNTIREIGYATAMLGQSDPGSCACVPSLANWYNTGCIWQSDNAEWGYNNYVSFNSIITQIGCY